MIKLKATRIGGDIEWFNYLSSVARFAWPSCHQSAGGRVGQCWDEAWVTRVLRVGVLVHASCGLFWLFCRFRVDHACRQCGQSW